MNAETMSGPSGSVLSRSALVLAHPTSRMAADVGSATTVSSVAAKEQSITECERKDAQRSRSSLPAGAGRRA
jgi:hypothetical protein